MGPKSKERTRTEWYNHKTTVRTIDAMKIVLTHSKSGQYSLEYLKEDEVNHLIFQDSKKRKLMGKLTPKQNFETFRSQWIQCFLVYPDLIRNEMFAIPLVELKELMSVYYTHWRNRRRDRDLGNVGKKIVQRSSDEQFDYLKKALEEYVPRDSDQLRTDK